MSDASAVAFGRAAAEARMTDACTITRPGAGDPVFDPESGEMVPPAPVTMYSGVCRVKAVTAAVTEVDAGERQVGVVRLEVHLPVEHATYDTAKVHRGDTVTVTAATLDPGLVGRTFTVSAGFVGSQNTARRLPVEAVE